MGTLTSEADIIVEVRLQSENDLQRIQQALGGFVQNIIVTDPYEYLGRGILVVEDAYLI